MVFVTTSGGSLCISPWKDGLKPKEIVHQSKNILSVLIIFPENDDESNADDESLLDERGLMELFQVIANDMPNVRSITISGGNYSNSGGRPQFSRRSSLPPLRAITSLLTGPSTGLLALCLVQIRLLGRDRDMLSLINAIRLHPTLHSFDCTGCVFEKTQHVNALKDSCLRKNLGHFLLESEYILEEHEGRRSRSLTSAVDDGGWGLLSYPLYLCWCI